VYVSAEGLVNTLWEVAIFVRRRSLGRFGNKC
jgi:hypothetical protein